MKQQVQWSLPFRYMAFGAAFTLLTLGLWYVRRVMEPLIIAAFVAYLINPAVNYLVQHRRMSRRGAVNLVYFVALAFIVGVPSTLTPIFFNEAKRVITDLLDLYTELISILAKAPPLAGIPLDLGGLADRLTQFRATFLSSLPDKVLKLLESTSLGALWILVVLVAVYYFMSQWPHLRSGLIGSLPRPYQPEVNQLYRRVRRVWMNYLRSQILLMIIVGVAFTIAWTVLGIPGALVLGVIAGFLTLIPDVGPFIAAMLAAGVALLEGSLWIPLANFWVMVIVIAVYLVLIGIKNLWLRPYIMGRSVHMHESLVFISIILATVLWGILGALVVVPVLASLAVILGYLHRRILGLPPFPSEELKAEVEEPAPEPAAVSPRPRRIPWRRARKVKE